MQLGNCCWWCSERHSHANEIIKTVRMCPTTHKSVLWVLLQAICLPRCNPFEHPSLSDSSGFVQCLSIWFSVIQCCPMVTLSLLFPYSFGISRLLELSSSSVETLSSALLGNRTFFSWKSFGLLQEAIFEPTGILSPKVLSRRDFPEEKDAQ